MHRNVLRTRDICARRPMALWSNNCRRVQEDKLVQNRSIFTHKTKTASLKNINIKNQVGMKLAFDITCNFGCSFSMKAILHDNEMFDSLRRNGDVGRSTTKRHLNGEARQEAPEGREPGG